MIGLGTSVQATVSIGGTLTLKGMSSDKKWSIAIRHVFTYSDNAHFYTDEKGIEVMARITEHGFLQLFGGPYYAPTWLFDFNNYELNARICFANGKTYDNASLRQADVAPLGFCFIMSLGDREFAFSQFWALDYFLQTCDYVDPLGKEAISHTEIFGGPQNV